MKILLLLLLSAETTPPKSKEVMATGSCATKFVGELNSNFFFTSVKLKQKNADRVDFESAHKLFEINIERRRQMIS